ncbi:MAG: hypothetical protein JSW50_14185 [Candidatus Latescibacterota bacterium]|nr:MAG: hypothetical protein JSW50_14185 [Candidatus Latescibacterota bacterium]
MISTTYSRTVIALGLVVFLVMISSASIIKSPSEHICNECGQKITGSYFETGSHFYHPECFTCEHCSGPIKSAYTTYKKKRYHNDCFEDHVALRCAVCGGIIQGEYLIDYWGNGYHTSHKGIVLQCDFCQRFIVGSLVDGMVRFPDGQRYCSDCAPATVNSVRQARQLMAKVAGYLDDFGIEVDRAKIRLRLVDRNELKRIASAHTETTKGFTDYHVTKNLFGRVKSQTIDVYILNGLHRTQMISTLAHELTHVWQFERGRFEQDPVLSEGSCNFAAYLVLRRIGGVEAEFLIEGMLRDSDPIYGEGFRRVKAYAEKEGLASWLKLLKKKNPNLSKL